MQIKTKKNCVPIKPVQSNVSFMSKSVKKELSINFDEFVNESNKIKLTEQYVDKLMQVDSSNWKRVPYKRFAEHGFQKVLKDPNLGKVTVGVNYGLDGENLLEKFNNWLFWKIELKKAENKVTILNCPIVYLDIPKKNIKITTTDKESSLFKLVTQKVLKEESENLERKTKLQVKNLYKDPDLEIVLD